MPTAQGIIESAAAAAEAMLGQAGAPTSNCCAVGAEAFAESNAVLLAEYGIAFGELAEAETLLTAEAEVSFNGWLAAETSVQSISATAANNPNAWPMVINLVLAEANVTEAAFNLSKTVLSAEIGLAAEAFALAETTLQAEATVFDDCCAEAKTEAEAVLAEAKSALAESALAEHPGPVSFGLEPQSTLPDSAGTDDIARIDGIGPALANVLGRAGITDMAKLAAVDPATTTVAGIRASQLARYKSMAVLLIGFPQLSDDDVELLVLGLGLKSVAAVEAARGTIDATAIAKAKEHVQLPAKYDDKAVIAILQPA